jgi:hypothetical protein
VSPLVDLLARSIPIIIGAGVVQLVIHLLRRQTRLKVLDEATRELAMDAGTIAVRSAQKSVALADKIRDNALQRAENDALRADALTVELARQVALSRTLGNRVVRLETEVEVLRAHLTLPPAGP